MVSILDNKAIAELVIKNGDNYEKINPETIATIVEDVTGTTEETSKTVQEHIDNKSIHLTETDIQKITKDNLKVTDVIAGDNISISKDPDSNQITISSADFPTETYLTKNDIKAADDSIIVTPSETDKTVAIKANIPNLSKYLIQQNIKSGSSSVTVEYVPDSNDVVISTNDSGYIYKAGEGISISASNVITNTKPDKDVVLTAGKNISIEGTYPNFTIIGTNDTTLEDWQPQTEYAEGTIVIYNNSFLKCIETHTSTDSFDETKWELLSGFSANREYFYNASDAIDTITLANEIPNKDVLLINAGGVLQQSQNYTLNPDHKTLTFIEPIPAGVIIEVLSMGNMVLHTFIEQANIVEWKAGLSFNQGNVCIYNNSLYVCKEQHLSEEPFDYTKWTLVCGYSKNNYFFDIEEETTEITLPVNVSTKNNLMVNIGNTLIQSDNYNLDADGLKIIFNEPIEVGARVEITIFENGVVGNSELPRPYLNSLNYLRVKEDESGYELINKDTLKTDLNIDTLTNFVGNANKFITVKEDETDVEYISEYQLAGHSKVRNTQMGLLSTIQYGIDETITTEYLINANDTITVQPGSIMDSTGTILLELKDPIIKNPNNAFMIGNNNGCGLKLYPENWTQPIMTSNSTPVGVVTTSNAQIDREGFRAMDGLKQEGNGWLADTTSAMWYYTFVKPVKISAIDFYNQGSGLTNWSKDIDIWIGTPDNVISSFTAINENYGHSHIDLNNEVYDRSIGLTIKNSYGEAVGANEIDFTGLFKNYVKSNAEYNIFIIGNDDGTLVDIGTAQEAIPDLPEGFTKYAKIGSYNVQSDWHLTNIYPSMDLNTSFQSGSLGNQIYTNKIETWMANENNHAVKIVEQWGSTIPSAGAITFPEPFTKLIYVMANGEKILTQNEEGFTINPETQTEINWVAKGYK